MEDIAMGEEKINLTLEPDEKTKGDLLESVPGYKYYYTYKP